MVGNAGSEGLLDQRVRRVPTIIETNADADVAGQRQRARIAPPRVTPTPFARRWGQVQHPRGQPSQAAQNSVIQTRNCGVPMKRANFSEMTPKVSVEKLDGLRIS